VVIVGVLIGASLMGILGALVAIPVAGALQILARDWWELRKARRPAVPETLAVEVPEGA
jgi:predicted PurR-regulated permease PerM